LAKTQGETGHKDDKRGALQVPKNGKSECRSKTQVKAMQAVAESRGLTVDKWDNCSPCCSY